MGKIKNLVFIFLTLGRTRTVMIMNNLRVLAFLIVSFFTLNLSAQFALELDSDNDHVITYEINDFGDTLKVSIEVKNDFSIDLDSDGTLDAADDFVYLMIDLDANDQINLGGSQVDLFYTYDSTQNKNLCNGHVLAPTNISSCEGTSGGDAEVELKASASESTPHLFYTFRIPTSELNFNGSTALCGRLSVKVHTDGNALNDAATFPTQTDAFDYYVNPAHLIKLYPEAEIRLPNGELAPDSDPVAVCEGDVLSVYDGYPEYPISCWFGFNDDGEDHQQTILSIPTDEYYFFIEDENDATCFYTDTISIQLMDNKTCAGAYKFPNVINPDNNGINDVFELMIGQNIINQDWTGAKLKIFNRWGAKVYESPDNAYPYWDLRRETGDLVTVGTYFYTFQTPGESPQTINGFFSVIHEE